MLYSIAKKYGLRHELKNIRNIHEKYSKKGRNYSNVSSSDDSDSDSSLAINSSWDTYIRSDGRKETKKLDHVGTKNLKLTKDKFK